MEKGNYRLLEGLFGEIHDPIYWGQTYFHIICGTLVNVRSQVSSNDGDIDKNVSNDAASQVYRKRLRYELSDDKESSCLTAIRLDSFITSIIESFLPQSARSNPLKHSAFEKLIP